jgi:hypothetical protein
VYSILNLLTFMRNFVWVLHGKNLGLFIITGVWVRFPISAHL